MSAINEPGWVLLAMHDPRGRRGLRARYEREGDRVLAVELCAGREGNDAHVRVAAEPREVRDLVNVLEYAEAQVSAAHIDVGIMPPRCP